MRDVRHIALLAVAGLMVGALVWSTHQCVHENEPRERPPTPTEMPFLPVALPSPATAGAPAVKPPEEPRSEPLERAGSLRGCVFGGEPLVPVKNALVAKIYWRPRAGQRGVTVAFPDDSTRTDERGAFEVKRLPPGLWLFRATAPGFLPVEQRVEIFEGTASDTQFRLAGAGEIWVLAHGPDSARGRAHREGIGKSLWFALRDSKGNLIGRTKSTRPYQWSELLPGRYSVEYLGLRGGRALQVKQAEVRAAKATVVEFELPPVRLHGRVRRNGVTVAGTTLTLDTGNGGWSIETVTNTGGAYAIEDAEPGDFIVRIGGRWSHGHAIHIPDEITDLEHDIDLNNTCLTGRVVDDATGRPVVDAVASARDRTAPSTDERDACSSRTNEEGFYSILDADSGSYDVWVSKEGYAPATIGPVFAAAREKTEVPEARLSKGGDIWGWVRCATGEHVGHARVLLRARGGGRLPGASEAVASDIEEGAYKLPDIAPGDYELIASGYDAGAARMPAHVDAGKRVAVDFELPPAGKLRLSVRSSAGQVLDAFDVRMTDGAGGVWEPSMFEETGHEPDRGRRLDAPVQWTHEGLSWGWLPSGHYAGEVTSEGLGARFDADVAEGRTTLVQLDLR